MSIDIQSFGIYILNHFKKILFFDFQNQTNRHTTNDQSTWVHQQLMIVEENDQKTTNQLSGRYIT